MLHLYCSDDRLMATLKGSFPSGRPVQCSALSIHKCWLSSVGSLGKVPAPPPTPPPKDCGWERGPSPACRKPVTHCHCSQLSPLWKWRELTSMEAFQKDPPSSLAFPSHPISSQPSVLKYQTTPVCFSGISGENMAKII